MNNGLDRGAGFISTKRITCNAYEWSIAVGGLFSEYQGYGRKVWLWPHVPALYKERGDRRRNCVCPCDMVSGTRQNMLRTVTSVERYHGIWKI